MNKVLVKDDVKVEDMIYEVRGKYVMIDCDLAVLYECTNGTKDINKAVKRNIERFPESFMFQLTTEEYNNLRFQIGTSSLNNNYGGRRYKPYVFTEQGVAMLSSVLHSPIAISTSIKIINAFVEMRKYISNNLLEQKYINDLVIKDSKRIDVLEETFGSFKEKTNHIFFEGQLYDAYSLLLDILNKAKEEIIIIDNYAGKELLDVLKNINKRIIIVSKNIDETLKKKYESQYSNIIFNHNESFHDRFIIIDRKILYMCGSSFKDIGKKCFYIGEITNAKYIDLILSSLLGGTIC